MMPVTLLKHEVVGHTDEAAKELRALLPEIKFTPKPTRLIRHLLQIAAGKDALVLDSFADSGTTAHAVLQLNEQDGGTRRFILTEMMDYASTLTAERVRRAIEGFAGYPLGGGFDYYTVGEPMFLPDDNLNPSLHTNVIMQSF
jgi:adenine-specific DNA-methyltransferase